MPRIVACSAPIACIAAAIASATSASADDTTTLTLIESGASAKIGFYSPIRLELSEQRPASLKKQPEGLEAPLYGVIVVPAAGELAFHVIVDEPEGKPARLFVDTNGNGDLTDDPAAEWSSRKAPGRDGKEYSTYSGGATLRLGPPDKSFAGRVNAYRFDKTDPSREALKRALLFYRDYAAAGELSLGGTPYKVMLDDGRVTGDFSGRTARIDPAAEKRADDKGADKTADKTADKAADKAADKGAGKGQDAAQPAAEKAKEPSPVRLLIDVNGNGRFESRGESFAVDEPFNIGGVTWELLDIAADGTSLRAARSTRTVKEIAPPPQLAVGKPIVGFSAVDMDGKTVNFPGDYKGKLVLLDFWATWCGPCMQEMPNVVQAFETYHAKGFEILGVTLDNKDAVEKIRKVAAEKGMKWPQIYDGGGWKSEVPSKFAITSIPAAFLVDGDTGAILAAGDDLRGTGLLNALEWALAKGAKESK